MRLLTQNMICHCERRRSEAVLLSVKRKVIVPKTPDKTAFPIESGYLVRSDTLSLASSDAVFATLDSHNILIVRKLEYMVNLEKTTKGTKILRTESMLVFCIRLHHVFGIVVELTTQTNSYF